MAMLINLLSANVLVISSPIVEECPVPQNTQTSQYFGIFFFTILVKKRAKMAILMVC